jgi:threonine dehydratase
LIHPFDDPLVIAGQGTIGDEILRQSGTRSRRRLRRRGRRRADRRHRRLREGARPDVRIIGVEPFEADAMYQSLAAGRRVQLDTSASSPTASRCARSAS